MEHFRSIFQSFQNCPKFENLNYEVLQCLTERFFRDNPYISVICHSKFQLQPIFPYSGVTDTGEGAMGKRPPPTPPPEKVKEKHFRENSNRPNSYIPRVSPISKYIQKVFSIDYRFQRFMSTFITKLLSYYQFLSEHIFSSFVPLVANHSFSRV